MKKQRASKYVFIYTYAYIHTYIHTYMDLEAAGVVYFMCVCVRSDIYTYIHAPFDATNEEG
jgi:hypothetical protein